MASMEIVSKTRQTRDGHAWENAYLQFQTPEEEVHKFTRRLRWLGCEKWPQDSQITEICCGRGGGLEALRRLGFQDIEGIDLSESLLGQYQGQCRASLGDCRNLSLESASRDIVIVQGGLHHVEPFPEGFSATLRDVRRVLRPMGRFVVVEPWATPFLSLVHAACRVPLATLASRKLWAIDTMNRLEWPMYSKWLASGALILRELRNHFDDEYVRCALGKLWYVGRPRGLGTAG